MSDNLAKALGEAVVESRKQPEPKKLLRPEVWDAARKAFAAGFVYPPLDFPVIIEDGSAITTPEELQKIIERTTVPEVIQTTTVYGIPGYDELPTRTICLCSTTFEEKAKLDERAQLGSGPTVLLNEKNRGSYKVLSLSPPAARTEDEECSMSCCKS
ncbi:hypothetical protein AK830_g10443 [Neonectria ditissima]|uniref:Uncharacterized protein n=1 Tax=Neonectria ditissima TaxID=78410 RepID=A0A0P7B729_9HYPO|nr:hypothetical protein AK830_g10443 [Neonectria ditissima]